MDRLQAEPSVSVLGRVPDVPDFSDTDEEEFLFIPPVEILPSKLDNDCQLRVPRSPEPYFQSVCINE